MKAISYKNKIISGVFLTPWRNFSFLAQNILWDTNSVGYQTGIITAISDNITYYRRSDI